MSRLTYQEKKRLPASAFALPERRMFPLVDKERAADAMARLSMSWNLGHLTESEYTRAHKAIRAAEARFGVGHHAGHMGARKVVATERRAMAHAGGGGVRVKPLRLVWTSMVNVDPKRLGRRMAYRALSPVMGLGGEYRVEPIRGAFVKGVWNADKIGYASTYRPKESSGWCSDVEIQDAFPSGAQRYPSWYATADQAKAAAERHARWLWTKVRP